MPAVGASYGRLVRDTGDGAARPDGLGWRPDRCIRPKRSRWEGIHQDIRRNNNLFRDVADSRGFDEAHRAGATIAEEAKTVNEWHVKAAHAAGEIAAAIRQTATAQNQRVGEADEEISNRETARPSRSHSYEVSRDGALSDGIGRYCRAGGALFIPGKSENTRAVSMLGNMGDIATAPPPHPVDDSTVPRYCSRGRSIQNYLKA